MYKIVKKINLAENIYWMDIHAPRIAKSALPGQFVIVKLGEYGERIPLTICDYNIKEETVSVVIQTIGKSTIIMADLEVGDSFTDFVGPLGQPSDFVSTDATNIKGENWMFIAGGIGAAPVYPQVKFLRERGIKCDVIIGARSKDIIILEKMMKKVANNVYISTDDGSYGFNGNVTELLKNLVNNKGVKYDRVVAIGPMIMMKFVALLTKELKIPTTVSMNPIMVDGTGMCGACRVTVGDKVKFACVDGPEFDGHQVNFEEAMQRQQLYKTSEGRVLLDSITPEPKHNPNCVYHDFLYDYDVLKRVPMPEQDPIKRAKNFNEVSSGYSLEQAQMEASRCINCRNAKCIDACPVAINIPAFIQDIIAGDIVKASKTISKSSSLPAVCGRVCPQEDQCEGACIRRIKGEAVAIGRLERFVGDYAISNNLSFNETKAGNGKKVAVVGAGPAGLTCAGELAKKGYEVKIFEALHKPGGVLLYGIPEFRLPKSKVVEKEIQNVINLGVEIETDVVVGRTIKIDELIEKDGFDAVFVSSGAGLPKFMNIPGENSNGVFSANEYLTRSNLMKAYDPKYDTPITLGKKVAVIGGGNVAMDAARTALRLGAEVHVVYRRSIDELPARLEEVHHAKDEGIIFNLLTAPIEIIADENGWVNGIKCVKMQLGEPDSSNRRSPIIVEGSEYIMEVDTVLMALGTSPNPLISATTKGLEINKWQCIVANEETGETSKKGVFAGGDVVTGAATVILAMGAGKKAAIGIDKYIQGGS